MHRDDRVAPQYAAAPASRNDQKRNGRGRYAAPRRLGPRRLGVLLVASLIGSASVVGGSLFVVPAKPPSMMAEPVFDVAAFYESHTSNRASRDGRSYWSGEPLTMRLKPVAGLSQRQTENAYIIVEVGRQMGLPKRAHVVAIATALQETHIRILANPDVPESYKYPHDGSGSNYDSIGIFQQRPSMGWGTIRQLMDPAQSAARFYTRLLKVSGWQKLSITVACQKVQRSAFPSAYAKQVAKAQAIVDALP